ncbi:MAG: hypothetical protein ACFUZC_12440 [Chthoniobacteraceae bacterium]
MEFSILASVHFLFFLLGLFWFLRRNDEIPLLISAFLFYISTYRYWAVQHNLSGWVVINNLGFSVIDAESALEALKLIMLGHGILLGTYMYVQDKQVGNLRFDLPRKFESWIRNRLFVLILLAIPIVYFSRASVLEQVQAGRNMGFEVSKYLVLLPMMLVGVGCLTILLWKFGAFKSTGQKAMAALALIVLAQNTFNVTGRFMFLGLLMVGGIILSLGCSSRQRLLILGGVFGATLAIFMVAGAMRNRNDQEDALQNVAWQRAISGEDANMLDGFVMLRQIYPARLNWSYGKEHFDILLRPIPRALWPGKPVGSYMNKLRLITKDDGFCLGISPSLFGSFYQEGGVYGIVLLSMIYGLGIAKLVVWSTRIHPFSGVLVRALLCASIVPLMRGGDLPGIFAWFGMSFWPCALILWVNREEMIYRNT